MISVAEQFSNLRDTLGSILGIFAILRWIRTLFAKIAGRPPPADAASLTPAAFAKFQGQPAVLPDGSLGPPRPSKKPFLVFILAAFGLPYLMGKFIRALAKSQDEAAQRQNQNLFMGPDGRPLPPEQQPGAVDPNQLEFCRLKYDYTPENVANMTPDIDLQVKKGDVVAVLAKTDPLGNASEWWRCRTRDGKIGYLPSPYLEVIKRTPKQLTQGSSSGSRAQTMTSGGASRTQTIKSEGAALAPPDLKSKVGDISVESFQKSQFYS
jgi:peroxin-13